MSFSHYLTNRQLLLGGHVTYSTQAQSLPPWCFEAEEIFLQPSRFFESKIAENNITRKTLGYTILQLSTPPASSTWTVDANQQAILLVTSFISTKDFCQPDRCA